MRGNFGTVLKIFLAFVLAGPLIGLIVFSVGVGVLAVAHGRPDGFWLTPFFLLYGSVFAHFVGLKWACLAAAAAATLALYFNRFPQWIGILAGGLSFVVAYFGGGTFLPPGTDAPGGFAISDYNSGFNAVLALTHVAAAYGAWLIVRGSLTQRPDVVAREGQGHFGADGGT